MKTAEEISDLLAHRDGERLDPERARAIDADPASRAELAVLRQLKHELNELPAVAPPPDAWANIQARSGRRQNRLARLAGSFPLATAATVCLATMIGILVWDPANLQQSDTQAPVPVADLSASAQGNGDARFAALMNRSQQLESALLYRGDAGVQRSAQEAALLYRIADLDAELSDARDSDRLSQEEREALWRQRVLLLEALAQTRRAETQAVVF